MSELDHEAMWRYLRDLLGRVCGALDGDAVMADGLDSIIDLLSADRGLVFLADSDGASKAVVGRRQQRPMAVIEREEIGKTFVREALETGRYVRFDRLTQQSISASAHSLGIVAALAAPLGTGPASKVRGVLYLDFRDRRRVVEDRHVELFLAAATVFGLLLRSRRGDIPLLAERFLKRADPSRAWTLSLEVRRLLLSEALEWEGNVRQLERVILRARERAVARDAEASTLLEAHFAPKDLGEKTLAGEREPAAPMPIGAKWQRLQAERSRLEEQEKDVLREALSSANGVVAHAARELGIARTTLSSRLDAVGLRVPKA